MVTIQFIEGETPNKKAFCVAINKDDGDEIYTIDSNIGIRPYKTVLKTKSYEEALVFFEKMVKYRIRKGHIFKRHINI